MSLMKFDWDEAKNSENIRKHEIDFADVPAIFDGEMLIELDDRFDYGEDQYKILVNKVLRQYIESNRNQHPA
jgi:uncharacterized DUF497 family protein